MLNSIGFAVINHQKAVRQRYLTAFFVKVVVPNQSLSGKPAFFLSKYSS